MKFKWRNIVKEWLPNILLALIFGIAGGFIALALLKHNTGSVADWVSGLGSIGAILMVYYQIKEQRAEYENDKVAKIDIAMGFRPIKEKTEGGGIVVSAEQEFFMWAVNSGRTAGSFKFIGFCDDEHFRLITNETDVQKRDKLINAYIIDVDPLMTFGIDSRKFEKIEPKSISKTISIPVESIQINFGKNITNLHAVYMDPLGKLYDGRITIHDLKDTK